jgi:hypothetical protein
MECYRTKRPRHRSHFLIYCASPSEILSFMTHPPELSGKYEQKHLVAKQGETWQEMSIKSAGKVSLSYSASIFNMLYNLTTWGRWLYFPCEESHATDFHCP